MTEADVVPSDPENAVVSPKPEREPRDWEWVEQWRASKESAPWTVGLSVALFVAGVVGCAIYVVSAGLADRPIIAIIVNIAVAGGVLPAIWLSRRLPVLRWIALGAALGIVAAWFSTLVFLL